MLSSAVSKWSVTGRPCGLTETLGSCNLLVTCNYPDALVEMRADSGQLVRTIKLQSHIKCLNHALQLTTGQYVVCHGFDVDDFYQVCMVDVEGRVTHSYSGRPGCGVGQLNYPRHLAVDEDSQYIFVADWQNNKVALLSPRLELVREFSDGVTEPYRLYFHQKTGCLFVGQYNGRDVFAIQAVVDVTCF